MPDYVRWMGTCAILSYRKWTGLFFRNVFSLSISGFWKDFPACFIMDVFFLLYQVQGCGKDARPSWRSRTRKRGWVSGRSSLPIIHIFTYVPVSTFHTIVVVKPALTAASTTSRSQQGLVLLDCWPHRSFSIAINSDRNVLKRKVHPGEVGGRVSYNLSQHL